MKERRRCLLRWWQRRCREERRALDNEEKMKVLEWEKKEIITNDATPGETFMRGDFCRRMFESREF